MINEIFSMNGYGLYVWSAFAFTLINFASLFLITKLQLLKEKRKFTDKFGSLDSEKLRTVESQQTNRKILEDILGSKI
jgi:heme exporter protein D|tara:strand:- start:224 stop:457 length:234 start_codon:yes stop_codon:yes gene_type:complete